MTLILAWRDQRGAIHLASDSRLNFDPTTSEDFVAKLLDVEVEAELLFNHTTTCYRTRLGFGILGGYALTQATWASVRFALRALQTPPWGVPIDMATLVEQVRRTMTHIGSTIARVRPQSSIGALLVVGYCANQNRARAFAVEAKVWEDSRWGVRSREILAGGAALECHGSGSKYVQPEHLAAFQGSPLLLLKYAIETRVDPAVGGLVQYGVVNTPGGFEVVAVRDYRVDHPASSVYVGFAAAGAFFDPALDFSLVRQGRVADPFGQVIGALLDAGYGHAPELSQP